jgi:hypothetical protein
MYGVRVLPKGEAREEVVDEILASPHKYTIDDIEWLSANYDFSKEQFRQGFINFDKFAFVEKNGVPIYAFGVDDKMRMNTLSHAALETNKGTMTKAVMRFMKTPEGVEFFRGAIGIAELSDSTPELEAWAAKLGFAKYARVDHNGQTFNFFHKGDQPHVR